MKKLLAFVVVILFCFVCFKTADQNKKVRKTKQIQERELFSTSFETQGYAILEIDSCEYIMYDGSGYKGGIAHKGNCKYCKNR